MMAVKEIKTETGTTIGKSKQLTKEITVNMFAELAKGQNIRKCKITFKDWQAIKTTVIRAIRKKRGNVPINRFC